MAIKKAFNKKENYLSIEYNWLVPKNELFNKQGTLAERLGDWSNFPKIYDDVIFNDVLGIDDSQAKSGQVNIMQSRDNCHYVMIGIYVANIKKLNSWILEESAEKELEMVMASKVGQKIPTRKPDFDPVSDYLAKAH